MSNSNPIAIRAQKYLDRLPRLPHSYPAESPERLVCGLLELLNDVDGDESRVDELESELSEAEDDIVMLKESLDAVRGCADDLRDICDEAESGGRDSLALVIARVRSIAVVIEETVDSEGSEKPAQAASAPDVETLADSNGATDGPTFTPPAEGFTCFHCGQRFANTPGGLRAARNHFGETPATSAACVQQAASIPPGTVNLDPQGVNAYGAVLQQQPEPPCGPRSDDAPREAAQEPKSARLSAKPLTWKEEALSRAPGWREWVDQRMGFHISYDPEEDAGERYIAAWGEGDPESFATVEEAKAWCQDQADSWVREIAVADAPPAPRSDDAPRDGTEHILLTSGQIAQLAAIAGRDDEPVEDQATYVVERCATGHSGPGVYAHLDEYPEEGAFYLDGAWPERDAPMREAAQEPTPDDPHEFGAGIVTDGKHRYWIERAQFWRGQAISLGYGREGAPQQREGASELEALRKFKAYVHQRLDEAGVEADPPSKHREAGCRIGGRLDIVLAQHGAPLRPVTDEDVRRFKVDYSSCFGEGSRDEVIKAGLESFRSRLAGERA